MGTTRASGRASRRSLSAFRDEYVAHVEERKAQGLVPKPLDPGMCAQLVEQLGAPEDDPAFLLDLLAHRVPPGVDEAAYVKASFLAALVGGEATSPVVDKYDAIYDAAGVRTETPGCSLCMGNQARVAEKATVVSTSTRNFPNRLGKGANVYLASAELAAVAAIEGKLPTPEVYLKAWKKIDSKADETYQYINFDTMSDYTDKAQTVSLSDDIVEAAKKAAAI